MDTVEGQTEEPLTLHKYLFGANNPTNNIDPSGEDFTVPELAMGSLVTGIIAAMPTVSYGSPNKGLIDLVDQPPTKSGRELAGAIFLESSGKYYPRENPGEDDQEKQAIGITFLNRAYYAGIYPKALGPMFGKGDLMDAIRKGSAVFINSDTTKISQVFNNDDIWANDLLKIKEDNPTREHWNLSVAAALEVVQENVTSPIQFGGLNNKVPVFFNGINDSAPYDKSELIRPIKNHNFYKFQKPWFHTND